MTSWTTPATSGALPENHGEQMPHGVEVGWPMPLDARAQPAQIREMLTWIEDQGEPGDQCLCDPRAFHVAFWFSNPDTAFAFRMRWPHTVVKRQ